MCVCMCKCIWPKYMGRARPPVHACSALSPCLLTVRAVPCPRPSAATVCPPAVFCYLRSPCFLPAAGSSSSVRARAPPPAACSIPSRSWPRRCQGAAQPFACSLAPLRSRGTRRVPCLPSPCCLSYDKVPHADEPFAFGGCCPQAPPSCPSSICMSCPAFLHSFPAPSR